MPPGKSDKQVSLGAGKFIIPSDPKGFQDPKYWDQFFSSRNAAFEWYGNFLESSDVLGKYIKSKDTILVIGSGNSELSAEMYYTGLKNITNIDISQVVVDRMTKKYKDDCPDMKFVKDDVMNMTTVENESFTVVLDKATFDALVVDDSNESMEIAEKIMSEVDRVLKFGGRYICITLAQRHVLNAVVCGMAQKGYAIRAHVINVQNPESERPHDVVFCLVFTKMKPGFPLICDIQLNSWEKLTRMQDIYQFLRRIQEHQYTQTLAKYLRLGRYDVMEDDGQFLKICTEKSVYHLYPLKSQVKKAQYPAACFIIPPGRAKSYLYGTQEGRRTVAESISAQLVMFAEVIETLSETFSFSVVKDDLTPYLKDLTPPKCFEGLVFMSDGDFPETCKIIPGDEIIFEGSSHTTGEYRILQRRLLGVNQFERRLVFLNSPNVVQTEMRVSKEFDDHGVEHVKYNRDSLPSDYQRSIIAAMLSHKSLSGPDQLPVKVLLIGLGGGILTSFIHENFPTATIEAIELDAAVIEIAIKFFGFIVDERCSVHVEDGLKFLREAAVKKDRYDIIILDADTKDAMLPLRCPPLEFVDLPMINIMYEILNTNGMLLVNLLSRQESIIGETKERLLNTFGSLITILSGVEDELNRVVVAIRDPAFLSSESGGDTPESVLNPSKKIGSLWKENIRRFNQYLDEKSGEILIDGTKWWKRVECAFSLDPHPR